jgi:hypothetical protein
MSQPAQSLSLCRQFAQYFIEQKTHKIAAGNTERKIPLGNIRIGRRIILNSISRK